jgi:hypothetical protein
MLPHNKNRESRKALLPVPTDVYVSIGIQSLCKCRQSANIFSENLYLSVYVSSS